MILAPPPAIPPLDHEIHDRPLFSVMIPVYNRDTHLTQTLESVLGQEFDPDQLQIGVIDDCSPDSDPAAFVKHVGGNRVNCWRNERNLGLAMNWNACIQRARGQWVHILHSDDYVLPGFYSQAERAISRHSPDAVVFRCRIVNSKGEFIEDTPDLSGASRPEDLAERFKLKDGAPVQCASVIVRRSVYESLGGFRNDLPYCVDMEMWSRIFSHRKTLFSPATLACFRVHDASAGAGQIRTGGHIRDYFRLLPHITQSWHYSKAEETDYRRFWLDRAHAWAMRFAGEGRWKEMTATHRAYWDVCETIPEKLRCVARVAKNMVRFTHNWWEG